MNTGDHRLMEQVNENIRFLLWQSGHPHEDWVALLRDWLNVNVSLAARIIEGEEPPDANLLARLEEVSGLGDDEIQFNRLVDETDILANNLKYVLEGFPRGGLKQVAHDMGVDQNTLSRWRSGRQKPSSEKQRALIELLGLPAGTNLERSPLFLSLLPVSVAARKQWLKSKIDETDPRVLSELFPALMRLFRL